MEQGKRVIGRAGVYMFFVSLILSTQINWVVEHKHFDSLRVEERLLFGFLAGTLLAAAIIALARNRAARAGKDPDALARELSHALSPGILFFFAAKSPAFLALGGGLCALVALYTWSRPFRSFVDSVVFDDAFRNTMTIKDAAAAIELSGTYDTSDMRTMQTMRCFLRDLVDNFHTCRQLEIEQVKVDISRLAGNGGKELVPVIEAIAGCFALRVDWVMGSADSRKVPPPAA